MKNVKTANYWQTDHLNPKINSQDGVVVLPSPQAFRELAWTKRFFSQKPAEGYFVWIKESPKRALSTCVTIASPKVAQEMTNLMILEPGVSAKIEENCWAAQLGLSATHRGYSKIILKENSSLDIRHHHHWGSKDKVNARLDFHLGKNARVNYAYNCLETPQKLKADNRFFLVEGSLASLALTIKAKNSQVETRDIISLDGDRSGATSRIRSVADKNSSITNYSQMMAKGEATGHVDCLGLLIADKAVIKTIPELTNENKNASLTHEAMIGRIQAEVLNYLRSRGLTEKQAINLVVNGFLTQEDPALL